MKVAVLYSYCLNIEWREFQTVKIFLEKTWSCLLSSFEFWGARYWNIREDKIIRWRLCDFGRT